MLKRTNMKEKLSVREILRLILFVLGIIAFWVGMFCAFGDTNDISVAWLAVAILGLSTTITVIIRLKS